MAERITFTHEELTQYFDRIALPPSQRVYNISSSSSSHLTSSSPEEAEQTQLTYLNLLYKHEACKVPWENLTQHYSWHHVVHLAPRHLFAKIVQPGANSSSSSKYNARGGYCMEANFFFHLILTSLGFDVHMSGSRIWWPAQGKFGGWTHVVNLVRIGGVRYLVDCGYGGAVACRPLALEEVEGEDEKPLTHIAPAQMRIVRRGLAQNVDRAQRVWIYQHRFEDGAEWTNHYCFTDLEFTPEDLSSMNFDPWKNPATMFTQRVVVMRSTTDREQLPLSLPSSTFDSTDKKTTKGKGAGEAAPEVAVAAENFPGSPTTAALEGEIDGALTIDHDTLKWRRHGKKVLEIVFADDAARVRALRDYFGIELAAEEVAGIRGTAAEIGAYAAW